MATPQGEELPKYMREAVCEGLGRYGWLCAESRCRRVFKPDQAPLWPSQGPDPALGRYENPVTAQSVPYSRSYDSKHFGRPPFLNFDGFYPVSSRNTYILHKMLKLRQYPEPPRA